jgi:hypothetical protein
MCVRVCLIEMLLQPYRRQLHLSEHKFVNAVSMLCDASIVQSCTATHTFVKYGVMVAWYCVML